MTKVDIEALIKAMLLKPPRPEKIATVDASREFKRLCAKAQSCHSLAKLEPIYNQLKAYY